MAAPTASAKSPLAGTASRGSPHTQAADARWSFLARCLCRPVPLRPPSAALFLQHIRMDAGAGRAAHLIAISRNRTGAIQAHPHLLVLAVEIMCAVAWHCLTVGYSWRGPDAGRRGPASIPDTSLILLRGWNGGMVSLRPCRPAQRYAAISAPQRKAVQPDFAVPVERLAVPEHDRLLLGERWKWNNLAAASGAVERLGVRPHGRFVAISHGAAYWHRVKLPPAVFAFSNWLSPHDGSVTAAVKRRRTTYRQRHRGKIL